MRQVLVCVLGLLLSLMAAEAQRELPTNIYPESMIVVEVDRENDVVTAQDFNGFLWEFSGTEDWNPGDICACIMDDMGTPLIFDDAIVSARYCGRVY